MRRLSALLIALLLLAAAPLVRASIMKVSTHGQIRIIVGRTQVIKVWRSIGRVSVGNEKVLVVRVVTRRQLLLVARSLGTTNVTIWDRRNRVMTSLTIMVRADLTLLKKRLYRILPRERILVHSARSSIVLTGVVSTPEVKHQAEAIAQAFIGGKGPGPTKAAPKGKPAGQQQAMAALKKLMGGTGAVAASGRVINLLRVGGVTQVLLKVRFAEVTRNITRRFSANVGYLSTVGDFVFTLLGGLLTISQFSTDGNQPRGAVSLVDAAVSANTGIIGGFPINNKGKVLGFIDALQQNGLAKILAEPNLLTTSGVEATFLAGGEFPVPIPQEGGTITVSWKKFGVSLKFKPDVLANGKIRLKVSPEVAEIDTTLGIQIQAYTVPGVRTRKATTTIELRPGQSFAIAGLFRTNITQTVSKIPLLGDIPILGMLFRSKSFQKNQTELVIVVTPYLIRPSDQKTDTLPTDFIVEPNAWQFFLLGMMPYACPNPQPLPGERNRLQRIFKGMDGPFGHSWSF